MSKKVMVSLVGLVVAILSTVGLDLPPAQQEILLYVITAITGSFNIGQGIADGLSKGVTSSTKK